MNRTWIVFLKETREVLRDRRVIYSTIVSPLLLTPLLLWGIGLMVQQREETARKIVLPIAVVTTRGGEEFITALQSDNGFTVQRADSRQQAEQMLRSRRVRAAVVLDTDFEQRLHNERSAHVVVLFDPLNDSSRDALSRLRATLEQLNAQWLQRRLAQRFISAEFMKPLEVRTETLRTENPAGNLILSLLLPYVIVLSAFFGAVSPAFDLVAGEKERGTIETLLATPASRRQIVWGKFLTIMLICMLAAIFAMLGMLLALKLPTSSHIFTAQSGRFSIPLVSIAAMVATLIPLTVFYSATLLIVSTFARNQKEAQTYLIPLSMLVVLPGVASMLVRTESSLWVALLPVLNSAVILKQVLTGIVDAQFVGLSLIASGLVAIIAMQIAARLFERETILLSS